MYYFYRFEEEKRGPFGNIENLSDGLHDDNKLKLMPKKIGFGGIESVQSSEDSSGSDNYRIEFDDFNRIKDES